METIKSMCAATQWAIVTSAWSAEPAPLSTLVALHHVSLLGFCLSGTPIEVGNLSVTCKNFAKQKGLPKFPCAAEKTAEKKSEATIQAEAREMKRTSVGIVLHPMSIQFGVPFGRGRSYGEKYFALPRARPTRTISDSWLFGCVHPEEQQILSNATTPDYDANEPYHPDQPHPTTSVVGERPSAHQLRVRIISICGGDLSRTRDLCRQVRNVTILEDHPVHNSPMEMTMMLESIFNPGAHNLCDSLTVTMKAIPRLRDYLNLLRQQRRSTNLKHVFVYPNSKWDSRHVPSPHPVSWEEIPSEGQNSSRSSSQKKIAFFWGLPDFPESHVQHIQPLQLPGVTFEEEEGKSGHLVTGTRSKKMLLLHVETPSTHQAEQKGGRSNGLKDDDDDGPATVALPMEYASHSEVLRRLVATESNDHDEEGDEPHLIHLEPGKSIKLDVVALMVSFLKKYAGRPAVLALVAGDTGDAAPWCPEFECFSWNHLNLLHMAPRWLQLVDLMELAVYLDIAALKLFCRASMITEVQLRNLEKDNASLLDAMLPINILRTLQRKEIVSGVIAERPEPAESKKDKDI